MSVFVLLVILGVLSRSEGWTDHSVRRFKNDFMFGVSTAAYQVEGGWDADGKGPSVWDDFTHKHPEAVIDGYNGDVASDSYSNIERDVEMLRELGVNFYRMSISWPRVLPTGHPHIVNEAGLAHYERLIDELLKYDIKPMITLFHFDLPQTLQDLGGWANPESAEWFEDYARVVFDRFASKVPYWITVNQPNYCMVGYGTNSTAPGVGARGIADYKCVKNMMVGHAKVYRLYEKDYKKKYKGSVGISISINWMDPVNNATDYDITETYRQFTMGLYLNPIWSKSGDFPKVVKDAIAKRSKDEGFPRSRLPELSKDEIKLLKGSADFLGMNHYTTFLVTSSEEEDPYTPDVFVKISQGEQWERARSFWLASAPYGLYKACLYLNKQYDYPSIIITENGWSTDGGLEDQGRIDYLKGYLKALLLAIEDGTDVKGYSVWSFMDNVEWISGISERFGLYEVDFSSPKKIRTPRHSAFFYKNVIETRQVDPDWEYKNEKMRIKEKKKKTEL